jgi:hypothetical protein
MKKIMFFGTILILALSCNKMTGQNSKSFKQPVVMTNELAFLLGSILDYHPFEKNDIRLYSHGDPTIKKIQLKVAESYCRKRGFNSDVLCGSIDESVQNADLQNDLSLLFDQGVIKQETINSFSYNQKMLFLVSSYLADGVNNGYLFCNGHWKKEMVFEFLNETNSSINKIETKVVEGSFPRKSYIFFKPSGMFNDFLKNFFKKMDLDN